MRTRDLETNHSRDRDEMRERLHVWDDDESDEPFYTDRYVPSNLYILIANEACIRSRWRAQRARHLATEHAADEKSRALEARQAEHLRIESETFLARQMAEMQSLAEEQRKAGLLLDDGAPVKLSISAAGHGSGTKDADAKATSSATAMNKPKPPAGVFGIEDEDEGVQKRKVPLVKIDFGGVEAAGRQERLDKLKASVKKDKETLFKTKIRWDGINDVSQRHSRYLDLYFDGRVPAPYRYQA
jgi:RNA-binding protein 25